MNNKVYQFIIDMIKIIMKFELTFAILGAILLRITDNPTLVWQILWLFPFPIAVYYINKFSKHIWSFIILYMVTLAPYLVLFKDVWQLLLTILYLIAFFWITLLRRLLESEHKSGHDEDLNTPLLQTAVFIGVYIYYQYIGNVSFKELNYLLAIIYTLLYLLMFYLVNFKQYINIHEEIAYVAIKQVKTINNILVLIFGVFCLFFMLIFSKVPLGRLFKLFGVILVGILRLFFSLFSSSGREKIEGLINDTTSKKADITYSTGIWAYLLKVLSYIVSATLMAAAILIILYLLYKLCKIFYLNRVVSNNDKVEFISAFEKTEKVSKKLKHNNIFHKLFGRTNNERIRKYFYKAVAAHIDTEEFPKHFSPTMLAKYTYMKDNTLVTEERDYVREKQIVDLYEKARYSDEECSKEELFKVKELLK